MLFFVVVVVGLRLLTQNVNKQEQNCTEVIIIIIII